jgi:hypothetical protein
MSMALRMPDEGDEQRQADDPAGLDAVGLDLGGLGRHAFGGHRGLDVFGAVEFGPHGLALRILVDPHLDGLEHLRLGGEHLRHLAGRDGQRDADVGAQVFPALAVEVGFGVERGGAGGRGLGVLGGLADLVFEGLDLGVEGVAAVRSSACSGVAARRRPTCACRR